MSTELFEDPRFKPRTFTVPGEPIAWARAGERIIGVNPKKRHIQHFDVQESEKATIVACAKAAGIVEPFDGSCGLDVVASWLFNRSWTETRIRSALLRAAADKTFLVPKSTRPDADNVGKLVSDALNGVAFTDDGRVWMVRVITCWGPRAETNVRVWYGDQPPTFPSRWWES